MCETPIQLAKVISWYFIGFLLGGSMFFLPDTIGRKQTMNFMLFFQLIAGYITVFSHSLFMKSIGFFMIGLFHMRVSQSFCYSTDLCPQKYRSTAITVIQCFDSGTTAFGPFIFMYVNSNVQSLYIIFYFVGAFACIMFLMFVPESPNYLLMKDTNSQRGI